ncbi:MAG: hypothetical protein ACFHU9_05210 [Fluviicola sp.]
MRFFAQTPQLKKFMSDFRENYFKARDAVAKELIDKYDLKESLCEYECLTLDSTSHSIHLTFVIPEGDEVYISKKGMKWTRGKSYREFLCVKYPNNDDRMRATKNIFKGSSRKHLSFEEKEMEFSFRAKILSLAQSLPDKFNKRVLSFVFLSKTCFFALTPQRKIFMSDFRENYFKARDTVAKELIVKYNLEESYRDENRLTLDSTNHSIHLTFYVPDGKGLNITSKGDLPRSDMSFMAHVFMLTQDNLKEVQLLLKEAYKSLEGTTESEMYTENTVIESYLIEIDFLNHHFPHYFS